MMTAQMFSLPRDTIIATAQRKAAPSAIIAGTSISIPEGFTATTTPKKPMAEAPTRASVRVSFRKTTASTMVMTGAT